MLPCHTSVSVTTRPTKPTPTHFIPDRVLAPSPGHAPPSPPASRTFVFVFALSLPSFRLGDDFGDEIGRKNQRVFPGLRWCTCGFWPQGEVFMFIAITSHQIGPDSSSVCRGDNPRVWCIIRPIPGLRDLGGGKERTRVLLYCHLTHLGLKDILSKLAQSFW